MNDYRPCDIARAIEPWRSRLTEDQEKARAKLADAQEWTSDSELIEALKVLSGAKFHGKRGRSLIHTIELVAEKVTGMRSIFLLDDYDTWIC